MKGPNRSRWDGSNPARKSSRISGETDNVYDGSGNSFFELMDSRNDLLFCLPGCRLWLCRLCRLERHFFAKAGGLNFQHCMSLYLIPKCSVYKSGNYEYSGSFVFAVQSFLSFCLYLVNCCLSRGKLTGLIWKSGMID